MLIHIKHIYCFYLLYMSYAKKLQFSFFFIITEKMGVDDELSTPILQNSDDDDERFRRRFNDDELDAGGQSGCCCNPSSGCHRFIALILMCLVGFGKLIGFFSLFCSTN